MRPPFLLLTLSSLVLAGSHALQASQSAPATGDVILIVIAGLMAHIAVNMLNEYADFISGLDFNTKKTPFSGGSGALIDAPEFAKYVRIGGVFALLVCILIGLKFVLQQGWPLLLIGATGVLLIITYSHYLNRQPWLCLIAPGLAFGPLMILGTEYALTGEVSLKGATHSILPFCLANNLLLVNQLPDIEADANVGRKHFAIQFGLQATIFAYYSHLLIAICSVLVGIYLHFYPLIALTVILPLCLGVYLGQFLTVPLIKQSKFATVMAINVAITLASPVLLALTLFHSPT